jgi:hypothetical protein
VSCTVESGAANEGEYIETSNVRVTGVKLGTLVTFDSNGNAVSHGSGLPKAYYRKVPKQVLSDTNWSDVASVDVGLGPVMAFSRAQLGSAQPNPWYWWGHLQCQLIASPDYDQSPVEGWETPGLPLAVGHQFGIGGTVRLRCASDNVDSANHTAITSIRITVFKLGSLQNIAL